MTVGRHHEDDGHRDDDHRAAADVDAALRRHGCGGGRHVEAPDDDAASHRLEADSFGDVRDRCRYGADRREEVGRGAVPEGSECDDLRLPGSAGSFVGG